MAIDYTSLAAVAQTLIDENGRAVTLLRLSATPVDAGKPWRGSDFGDVVSVPAIGVIVDVELADVDGDLVRRGDEIAFIAASGLSGADLELFDLLRDENGREWKIIKAATLRPGPTTLLFELQLRK